MLIVTSAVAALLAAAPLPSSSLLPPPPMIVNVTVDANLSASLVARMLDEATSIWSLAGLPVVWQRTPNRPRGTITVKVGSERGSSTDGALPLGWIRFDDVQTPEPQIYVSDANARALLAEWGGSTMGIHRMPVLQQEVLLARAMGRALAHELGHYLLASKAHTRRGLMRTDRSANDFFTTTREGFTLDPAQRAQIAARFGAVGVIVSR
jgi:hypothetical protein